MKRISFISWTKNKRGSVIVLFALMVTVLAGAAAMVFDVGVATIEKQKMQNALDAAAIAAVQDLPDLGAASVTAFHFMEVNGYSADNLEVITDLENSSITLLGKKEVQYTFARLIGFDSILLTPQATAEIGRIRDAFDYALFSGNRSYTMTLNGSKQTVEGNAHSNYRFTLNGSKMSISGICSAMSTILVNGSQMNIPDRRPNSEYVVMPDFSSEIETQALAIGEVYNGNKTYNGGFTDVDGAMVIDGDLTVNGSHFRGKGCILVTGNITFNGSNLNATTEDAVCFYSKNGNITVNGSNAELHGIVYAPNGKVTMNGSNQTIYGRCIADKVLFNGSGLSIISDGSELKSLPAKAAKLIR